MTLGYLHESVGTGRFAPSVAAVSVANPVVSIAIGVILLDETISRPMWHIVVAIVGIGLALIGTIVISLAHEAAKAESPDSNPTDSPVAVGSGGWHRVDR